MSPRRPGSHIVDTEEALEEIRAGRMIILMDDEDRENEGDPCVAADRVTAEHINFMATYGRGLVCLSLTEERCEQLGLSMMVKDNRAPLGTAFTVSIDARQGIVRGISAIDRATTVRTAIRADAGPTDIVTPGHDFPLRARRGGVLVRAGQTEGAVDLARLAGFAPAGVICEVMREDGAMARLPDLEAFAEEHGLKIATIADLLGYRGLDLFSIPGAGTGAAPSTTFLSSRSSIFRDFGIGAQILRDIGVGKIRWLTNNPLRLVSLPGYGLEIVEWVPLSAGAESAPRPGGDPRPARVLPLR